MRCKQIEIKTWEELNKEEQEIILEKYRYINTEHEWWNLTYEDFKEEMSEIGIKVKDIYFDFYSQGSGACFLYEISDMKKLINSIDSKKYRHLKKVTDYIGNKNVNFGIYNHEKSVQHEFKLFAYNNCERLDSLLLNFEKDFEQMYQDKCREIHSRLENEYEYLTSDESLLEYFKGFEFNMENMTIETFG